MPTIRKREGKYATTYRAEICVNGRRLSATFNSKSKAMMWAEDTEYLLRTGQHLPGEIEPGDMDFGKAVDKYTLSVAGAKKKNTQRLDTQAARRLVCFFADKTLGQITPKDIAEYRDYRLARVGSSSINYDLSFLACLFRMARIEWGLKVGDPGKEIKRPAPPKHRRPMLTRPQIDKLLDWCCVSDSKNLYCYVLLLLHTAMRPSEAAGLRWDQVMFEQRILDLTETKTEPRRVPLTETAVQMIARLDQDKEEGNLFVFLPKGYKNTVQPFSYFRRAFETARSRAGLHISLYGLRHLAGSYLVMLGVDIRTVAEIMGHKNISMTMRYTHFLDAHKIKAVNAVNVLGL